MNNNKQLVSVGLLILFAALTRLFPHYPNFTAIGATAIFGGLVIKDKKTAILLPLAALFISDIILQLLSSSLPLAWGVTGFYGIGQTFVYGAFILIAWLTTFIKKKNVVNIAFAGVWSGVLFFLISNFGVWLFSTFYPRTLTGLLEVYSAGLPFFNGDYFFGSFFLNTIMGNLFFLAVLYGAYAIVIKPAMSKEVAM